ncbi:hypothetical protein ABIB82_004083 [Bradyrhizobium sp. i1.8.4]|uniref:hypothetical protein n=1 Tax=unclassified Bradyrhizobium TaxID=2631580 RepID=UPI003D1A5A1F
MLTAFLVALGLVLLFALCWCISYQIGFREGREQGLTDSYQLYATKARSSGEGGNGRPGPEKASFRISANARIVIGSTLFALASSAFLYLLPPSPIDRNLLRGSFYFLKGHAYQIPVKYLNGELNAARLYEDDKLLGPANSDPQDIAAKGGGRFQLFRDSSNFFGPVLLLSTSDNTNPNTNGRKYHLE